MQQKIAPSAYHLCAEVTEQHLLSWMLNSEKALAYVAPHFRVDLFYDVKCKEIAQIFAQLMEEGEEVNWQTVTARLNAQENAQASMLDIINLMDIPGSTTAPIGTLLKILDMYRKCRALVDLSQIMWITGTTQPQGNNLDKAIEQMLHSFDEIRQGIDSPIITLEDSVRRNQEIIRDNQSPDTRHTGMPTGFRFIDQWGGLPIGMTVLGAKSSHGKSAMAMAWALHAAKSGMKVAFFSFEMLSEELSARALAMETRHGKAQVSANAMLRTALTPEQMAATDQAVQLLKDSGCLTHFLLNADLSSSATRMELEIRQLAQHSDVKAFFIDYLQIVGMTRRNGSTREELIGELSHRLHALAVQLQIHIVVLSQINRTVQGEPTMHQLRDSGQIAEAADCIAILWRPEQDRCTAYNEPHQQWPTQGTALLKVEKFRNGPTGDTLVRYIPHLTCYEDAPEEEKAPKKTMEERGLFEAELFNK